MRRPEDFAGGNLNAPYCSTCAWPDGALKPFDVVVEANAEYFQRHQGISPDAARAMARALLLSKPPWQGRSG
jgi:hypothetical protein